VIWDRDDPHPVARTMSFTWDEVIAMHGPLDPEVWLNPADWADLGRPEDYMGAPIRTSLGVPSGGCRIFDRRTMKYLPPARPS
jgi:hypothetical protein